MTRQALPKHTPASQEPYKVVLRFTLKTEV